MNDIVVFAAVVRARSFARAAKELGLPPSTVSRRVARLEGDLGFTLLHRTTRKVGLTESGRVFFERTANLQRTVDDAVHAMAVSHSTPSGLLRVAAPPDDGGVIWSLLSGFLQDHPQVDLDITHTLERVDLFADGVDVALRGGARPDSTQLTSQLLFDSRILLAASPDYLAVRGTPTKVADLEHHDGLCMDGWAPNAIRRLDGDRGFVRVNMRGRLRANRLDTAQRAALAGLGIAPLLKLTCDASLRSGALVEVLRGALPESAEFWVLSRLPKERSAAATALVRHVVSTASRWNEGME